MCQAASFIVTREMTYFSKTSDSHTVIFEENGLKDDGEAITVEVTPPDDDYSLPFEKWEFKVDSNHKLPEWWNAGWAEQTCRELLPEWAKHHLFIGKDLEFDLTDRPNPSLIFVNCKVKIKNQQGGECNDLSR